MATYKRYYKNNVLLGSGTYKYRPYTVLTPTVTLSLDLTGCSTLMTSANRVGTTSISFMKNIGYNWPTSVQVTGATAVSWNQNTGVLVIEKPTMDTVIIKVVCIQNIYSLTENLTNIVASGTHPTSIGYGDSATLLYTAAENYELPDNINVTGASYTWAQDTGTLVISNVTTNVVISMAGVYLLKVIPTGTYVFKDSPAVTATHAQFAFITNDVTSSGISVVSTGITYNLSSPMGNTQVYTAATNAWTLSAYKTIVLSEEAHVSDAFYTWFMANVQPKLETPQNVSISGTTLSFDPVENATSYDILANGTSIGIYTPTIT